MDWGIGVQNKAFELYSKKLNIFKEDLKSLHDKLRRNVRAVLMYIITFIRVA